MTHRRILILASSVLLASTFAAVLPAQDVDPEGCRDHPLLSRMKNYVITECLSSYDEHEFYLSDEETRMIEGNRSFIAYRLRDESPDPSLLTVRRNHTNALKSIGAKLLFERDNYASWTWEKDGRFLWISLQIYDDGWSYELNFVEVAEMVQEVTADAMYEALTKDGFIALYINFDTGKSEIKPESRPTIDQIVALLESHDDLRLSIEGHTDNVGQPAANKTLSEGRAKAVVAAVVGGGVDAARLTAVGWGQEKPVADNRSEEGRAKNRRVEIVKK